MSYQKQGFYSGGDLYASQLEAMEDGIINAEKLATELENDASHIYDKQEAFEPITWDGVIGDREVVTRPNIMPGIGFVKLSDVILTREDYIGSTVTAFTPNGEESVTFTENDIFSDAEEEQDGIRGVQSISICTIVDINKANNSGFNCKTTGTYGVYYLDGSTYIKSFSKTTIEIKEDVLPELPSGVNMEKGTGVEATQQTPRMDKVSQKEGETAPHFDFTGHTDAGMAGRIQYGAVGNYSASMNGRSSALNKHAFAINNSTIAKGEESFAQGYESIAEGNSSSAMGSRTWAKGTASHTEGLNTYAEGEGTHAEGSLTKAIGNYSHSEGYLNTSAGMYSHTEGSATQSGGFAAHAEGNETLADTDASHAEGSGTKVISYAVVNESGDDGSSEGDSADTPNYNDYESLEDYRRRGAACAHAQGNNTTAMGYSSHAQGVGTKAYGRASHTEGWETQTGELVTIEEGDQTYNIPHPEKGLAAHADGYKTKAIANYSQAGGFETIADRDAQTVVGQYNNKTSRNGSLFVVGGGTSDTGRKNVLEVISDGEIVIYWEGNYYSLNNMLNLIANAHGGPSFFDAAKK